MGSLYKRGTVWWAKYYRNGLPVRESTGKAKEKEAVDFLKKREGAIAEGRPIPPRVDRIRYEEARDDLVVFYQTTGGRKMAEVRGRLAHLDVFLRGARLADVTGDAISKYIAHRQAEGAANGTVNREVGVLLKMLRLAFERSKLLRLPIVHKPKEAAPRQGFFEAEQYEAVRRRLPEDLQTAAAIAYTFGWRTQSEVLTLTQAQVDLEAGVLRLEPGMSKNDDGREVYMPPDLRRVVAGQVDRVRALERELGRIIPHLFPHLSGKLKGRRRIDYRKAWASACKKTGVSGRLRHDLRRTAVRNLVNAGVAERVAMTITGHKTRAVFDRYHIVSPADLQEAARKLAGTIPGTITPSAVAPRGVSSDNRSARL